jgi:hypothetical protein
MAIGNEKKKLHIETKSKLTKKQISKASTMGNKEIDKEMPKTTFR